MPSPTAEDPDTGSASEAGRLPARISIAAEDLRRIEVEKQGALQRLGAVVWEARREQMAWHDIAEITGLTERYLRHVADQVAPQPSDGATGLSVTEAARRLSVTRPTIYSRIERGELRTTRDEKGRLRVLLEPSD